MKKLKINLKHKSYEIFYKKNLLHDFFIIDFCQKLANNFVIITHKSIKNIYAKPLFENFLKKNVKVKLLSFEDGEENKTIETKTYLEEQMLKDNFTKDSLIIAIGGGIVSDISGFIAATYMRGISYVIIPTTLLAMVDASIGGKTAVNTKYGKNLIGAIYHPKAVFIDFEVLKTLSNDEMKNGLVEMLKHALIMKAFFFYDLLKSKKITQNLIIDSLKIKKQVIEKDENEKSIRKKLNFGHSISHAIEASLNYKMVHGKALAWGILIESYLSYKMNFLSYKNFEKIYNFLKQKQLLVNHGKFSKDLIIDFLKRDKKNIFGKNRFTLLKNIGKSIINVEIIENHIVNSLALCLEVKHVSSNYYRS
ncbi:MAG: 3-dehydroquinate synthase [Candidatus Anoxychlamydiales bacterium]|nr:3-dehydroquinate synthase [Candidatus Anoxychlamydiales bacterium]